MIVNDPRYSVAIGHMKIGLRRLASKYPFHAKTLERFRIYPRPDIGTMGVTASADEVQLLYAPDFVLAISLDEVVGVLLHEVHHVIFGHLLANPLDYPDRWARIMAEEVTVNEFVREPLPGEPIRLAMFPDLPPLESTRRRYERLKRCNNRLEVVEFSFTATGGIGQQLNHSPGSLQPSQQTCEKGTMCDNHSLWDRPGEAGEGAQAAVRAALQDAAIDVGWSQVPDYLRQSLRALGIGLDPGSKEELLGRAGPGQLDWRRLLRRYVGTSLLTHPDLTRPPRRFPELVGMVPGKRRRSRPHLMAVIDTSASMTSELLAQVSAELARMTRDFEVTVVECDAVIQQAYRYRPLTQVRGRGGTSFCPPFERSFLRKHRPDVVVYFTDGHGRAPARGPQLPVIWCLTPEGVEPAKWGRIIRMA